MTAILLTPTNLHDLKSRLRAALPNAKSSHLSEALAAALGYRTHAALLADMKASPEKYPPLGRASDRRLTERLSEFGAADHAVDLTGIVREGLSDPIWRVFPGVSGQRMTTGFMPVSAATSRSSISMSGAPIGG